MTVFAGAEKIGKVEAVPENVEEAAPVKDAATAADAVDESVTIDEIKPKRTRTRTRKTAAKSE